MLLLCSRRLPLDDDELTAIVRRACAPQEPLDDVLRELVQAAPPSDDRHVDVGLVLARRSQ